MASEAHMFSSPVRATYEASHITVSSSPDFPSLDDLLSRAARRPALRTGSRAAAISETAFRSFTTAATVLRVNSDQRNTGQRVSDVVESLRDDRVNAPTRSTVVDESETVVANKVECAVNAPTGPDPDIPKPKPKRVYKPRVKKTVDSEALDPAAAVIEAPPKPKARRKVKEKDTAGQTTLAKGKVTKATVTKPKDTKKRSETVSKHFTQPAPVPAQIIEIDDPVEHEPALARRIDSWTPTKDTTATVIVLDSSTTKEVGILTPSAISPSLQPRKHLFTTLRDTYACAVQEDQRRPAAPFGEPIDILGKRKLIEMVTTGQGGSTTPEVSPTKPKAKAVKRKPRTITELATAAYRVAEEPEELEPGDESLLNYFAVDQQPKPVEGEVQKPAAGKPKATKAGPKAKPKKATKKKVEVPKQILLSPASALRQVSRQGFVFGTSSQLATEEDAGLLRDLQLAMKASNQQQEEDNPFASSPVICREVAKLPSRRLWAAGARDGDGELLKVEVIDLVDDVDIPEDLTNQEVILSLAEPSETQQPGDAKQSVAAPIPATINSIVASSSIPSQSSAQPTSHFFSTQVDKATTTAPAPETINSIPNTIPSATSVLLADLSDWDDEPPASNQEHFHLIASQAIKSPPQHVKPSPLSLPPTKSAQALTISESIEEEPVTMPVSATRKAPVPKMPDFEKRTDEQLANEIKKYGFKPVKRRGPAIALLTQCWLSKNKAKLEAAGQVQGTTASMSTTSTTAAKSPTAAAAPKPRGRPKKAVATVPAVAGDTAAAVSAEPAKKPRGRPHKDAGAAEGASKAAKPTAKRTAKVASLAIPTEPVGEPVARPSTPKRRKKSPPRSIVEIADSEGEDMDPLSPSPSLSPEPANDFSPPPQLDVSMTEDDSLTLTPTDDQAATFKYITYAVKTAPRTSDPETPSWHEKMLMYDPVVLEDLTVWLNGGQLTRVGWDGEVSTADVRKWCESQSVCCVTKLTWNGKDRARF